MKYIFIVFVVIFTLNSCNQQENMIEAKTPFHIPLTVSKEAKEIIGEWSVEERNKGAENFLKADAPLEEWVAKQKEFNEMEMEPLPELLELYKPTVDTIDVGGIRAIDVKPNGYIKNVA